jgi:hypothetical protein
MSAPEAMPWEAAEPIVRAAVRYTAVVLLVGRDPDNPDGVFVDEIRNPARELDDALLVRALRDLIDRVEGRADRAGQ